MNSKVHVLLWLLLGLLLPASISGSVEQSWLKLSRNVDRRLLGNDKEKTELAEEIKQVEHDIAKVRHDIKVVKGFRGKPSRLDKLDKENQQKLCWWSENFSNYAYVFAEAMPRASLTGIHFQVPQNMKAFKFTKRPTNKDDFFLNTDEFIDLDSYAHYFVTRITGQYDSPADRSSGGQYSIQQFRSRDVLYSGRNPPSEIPVNHKDHLFVTVTYAFENPLRQTFPGFRKLLTPEWNGIYAFQQVCRCSDMSDRVGAPVGLALVRMERNGGGSVSTTGGKLSEFWMQEDSRRKEEEVYDYFSDYNIAEPNDYLTWENQKTHKFLVCALIPLEASRCF